MAKSFFQKPLKVRALRGLLLAAVLGILVYYVPTPYRLEAPGRAESVGPMVTLETKTYPTSGRFILPTVVSEPATLLFCIYSLFDPDAILIRKGPTTPMAQSPGDGQMALSQYISSIVALQATGYDFRGDFAGLRVLRIDDTSPNHDTLRVGDVLTQLNGAKLQSFADFKNLLDRSAPGDSLSASVNREGQDLQLKLKVYAPQQRPVLGVIIRPEVERKELPFPINFRSGSTVGASGGLVFALEIYDRLTPEDLTRGRTIAATGTLDLGGQVGEIEGLPFKIRGAARAGATILLYPKGNGHEITDVPEGLEVIPVTTFNEALDALRPPKKS